MKLYEIDNEILSCVDVETGEVFDEEKYDSLQLEREVKLENLGLWIKNLKAEAEALKAEKDSFAKRQKAVENKMESIKSYLTHYLEGTPFKSTKVQISFRPSEAVEVIDINKIPDEFLSVETKVKKQELKQAIKQGLKIEGAIISENTNIQIK